MRKIYSLALAAAVVMASPVFAYDCKKFIRDSFGLRTYPDGTPIVDLKREVLVARFQPQLEELRNLKQEYEAMSFDREAAAENLARQQHELMGKIFLDLNYKPYLKVLEEVTHSQMPVQEFRSFTVSYFDDVPRFFRQARQIIQSRSKGTIQRNLQIFRNPKHGALDDFLDLLTHYKNKALNDHLKRARIAEARDSTPEQLLERRKFRVSVASRVDQVREELNEFFRSSLGQLEFSGAEFSGSELTNSSEWEENLERTQKKVFRMFLENNQDFRTIFLGAALQKKVDLLDQGLAALEEINSSQAEIGRSFRAQSALLEAEIK